jgi:hypothetical protein
MLLCVPPAAEEEERWRRWVDDRFVRVITINIYRNGRESFQTFDYIAEHGNFSWPERQAARVVGALMMWALSGVGRVAQSAVVSVLCSDYIHAKCFSGTALAKVLQGWRWRHVHALQIVVTTALCMWPFV